MSFLRSFVFQVAMIFIIPLIFKDGVWLAVVAAEILGVIVSVYFLKKNKIKYGY
jgi:hypothetical protein